MIRTFLRAIRSRGSHFIETMNGEPILESLRRIKSRLWWIPWVSTIGIPLSLGIVPMLDYLEMENFIDFGSIVFYFCFMILGFLLVCYIWLSIEIWSMERHV